MKVKDLLLEKKSTILTKWFDKIIESYPADSTNFLRTQKNQFANPVGSTIREGINDLFDVLVQGADLEVVYPFLNDIIRVMAVQGFTPSQAVLFVFLLKPLIRDTVGKEMRDHSISEDVVLLESRIDEVALLSFDIFMKSRERIYEIKADEVKRMTFRLLQRANLVCEVQETEPDPDTVITNNIKG
jgi:hypothetical protein